MIEDTYFNANFTNEAIYFGRNSGIYVPDMGWGFMADDSRGVAAGGVGYNPPPRTNLCNRLPPMPIAMKSTAWMMKIFGLRLY